jgi:uncharacterized membrane protein
VIPLSWFTMGFASYALSVALVPRVMFLRPIVSAAFLTCWDLVIDPAMSNLTQFWCWADGGAYYGTPAVNFLGWLMTGLAISVALEYLLPIQINSAQHRWLLGYYLALFTLPLGMMIAAGLWMASLFAITCLVAMYLAAGAIGSMETSTKVARVWRSAFENPRRNAEALWRAVLG